MDLWPEAEDGSASVAFKVERRLKLLVNFLYLLSHVTFVAVHATMQYTDRLHTVRSSHLSQSVTVILCCPSRTLEMDGTAYVRPSSNKPFDALRVVTFQH